MRIQFKNLMYKIIIIYYVIYMILGNYPRIINISFFRGDNILLTELILYLFSSIMFVVFLIRKKDIVIKEPLIISTLIIISNLINVFYIGFFNNISFLYSFRILLLNISSIVVGYSLFKYYGLDINKVIILYIKIFFIYSIIGWYIYIRYPNSNDLWMQLSNYGIIFNGDPHIRRVFGSYFDPNYFGNILVFVIILTLLLFNEKTIDNKKKYLIYLIFFIITLLYTFSRSSLLGLFISVFIIKTLGKKNGSIKGILKNFLWLSVIVISLIILYKFQNESIIRMINRFNDIKNDKSAMHRFYDFQLSINFYFSSLRVFLIGIGYNNIYYVLNTSLSSFDSSIFTTLVCLGILGSSVIIVFFYIYFKKINIFLKSINKDNIILYIKSYVLASIIICNFNNLLFYQFYIMLIMVFLNYIYFLKKGYLKR